MRLKHLLVAFLSILMLSYGFDADAQRNKYKKRKKTSKQISKYRGGSRGFGRFKPYPFVGININAGNYMGDLAPKAKNASIDFGSTRPGFGLTYGYRFSTQAAFRAAFNWVRISADDFSANPNDDASGRQRYARNLSFRNDLKELQAGLQVYLFKNHGNLKQRPIFNAYAFFGLAVTMHEPRGKVPESDWQADPSGNTPAPSAGEWVKLRELGTEGQNLGITEDYSNIIFAIPLTIGADLKLGGTNLDVGIEAGVRFTFSDYLDDVSTDYVDLDLLDPDGTNPLARIMSDRSSEPQNFEGELRDESAYSVIQRNNNFYTANGYGSSGELRGSPDGNDYYFMTQLKVTYNLNTNSARKRSSSGRGRAKFR